MVDLMMDLETGAAFWVLDLIPTADLPRVAADALEVGLDSPALRILAGELHPDVGELERLFSNALEEFKIEIPSRSEAMMVAAKYYATAIVYGNMSPREAGGNLWGL